MIPLWMVVALFQGPLSQAVLATTPASGESLSSSGGVSSEQTVLILREELEIEEFEGLQEAVEKFRCRGRPEGYHVAEGCAMYHVCAATATSASKGMHRQSFLCPQNETFDSSKLMCLPRDIATPCRPGPILSSAPPPPQTDRRSRMMRHPYFRQSSSSNGIGSGSGLFRGITSSINNVRVSPRVFFLSERDSYTELSCFTCCKSAAAPPPPTPPPTTTFRPPRPTTSGWRPPKKTTKRPYTWVVTRPPRRTTSTRPPQAWLPSDLADVIDAKRKKGYYEYMPARQPLLKFENTGSNNELAEEGEDDDWAYPEIIDARDSLL